MQLDTYSNAMLDRTFSVAADMWESVSHVYEEAAPAIGDSEWSTSFGAQNRDAPTPMLIVCLRADLGGLILGALLLAGIMVWMPSRRTIVAYQVAQPDCGTVVPPGI